MFRLDVGLVSLALTLLLFASGGGVQAQTALSGLRPLAQVNRVAASADLSPRTQLSGHVPMWVSAGVPVGSSKVDLSAPLHVSVLLRRDAAVQAAFTQFLAEQQNPSSPLYHAWLTPQQVGTLFGPTVADVTAVGSWLTSQGLTVESVSPSRMILEVSGSTSAVGNAFRTSFGYFELKGAARFSAVTEPSIPTALTAVIDSIHGLTDVPITPTSVGSAPQRRAGGGASSGLNPDLTLTSSSGAVHYLTPGDFATVFDINSVYNNGNKGATIGSKAQHVAIIGRSRVSATDISEYAANVGVTGYTVNTVIPTTGVDPGPVCTFTNASTCTTGGDQGEQTLDVDRVIGTAPSVQTDLVVSGTVGTNNGIYLAIAYNVNTLLDPVMTISYGSCEYYSGFSGDSLWDSLFSTGAAEGISTFVSSGDSGVNACAPDGNATSTAYPASINSICASTYATCVGGTEFNDTASPSTYWSSSNSTTGVSALSYIPEGGWNEFSSGSSYYVLASGGGPSTYISKPSWQTGTGVPSDGHRDTPDVSFPAASHDGYYVCLDFELGLYASQGILASNNCSNAGGGYFFDFSGTSAAAPAMAGVAALLNTQLGLAQGNLNPLLYKLAAGTSGSSVFHDTTVATSGVSGCVATTPSLCNNSTPGPLGDSTLVQGGLAGYLLTAGYDEVTGLGSVDVANLLTAAVAVAPTFSVTPQAATLSLASGATTGNTDTISVSSVNSFIGTVALTCTVTSTSGTAAGTCSILPASVSLSSNSSQPVLTIATTAGTSGTLSVTVTGTSGTLTKTSTAVVVTLTAPSLSLSAPAAISLTSGATTGNTTTTTLSPVNGFSGTVALSCTISSGTEVFPPTCAVSPASAALTSGPSTETITISSTTAQAKTGGPVQAGLGGWGLKGSVMLALLTLCLAGRRRSRGFGLVAMCALLSAGLMTMAGCGGSSGNGTPTVTHGSSAGNYTVTVSATGTTSGSSIATTATTTFALTIH